MRFPFLSGNISGNSSRPYETTGTSKKLCGTNAGYLQTSGKSKGQGLRLGLIACRKQPPIPLSKARPTMICLIARTVTMLFGTRQASGLLLVAETRTSLTTD